MFLNNWLDQRWNLIDYVLNILSLPASDITLSYTQNENNQRVGRPISFSLP